MINKKIYYSISEVAKIIEVPEHTIRFWDSKLPGLSRQIEKGKTRFFSQQQINKLLNISNLLKKNDSLNLAFEIASKNKSKNNFFDSGNSSKKTLSTNHYQVNLGKIKKVIINLKDLLSTK
ncbi:MAG: MerR family transcriptional regulator [Pelagibacteraceae bacterium]|jgi:DNA-binding transcriptional MerR regulator|nr:MerR family transcriptional regulator [Pelagibacteraceae bacterium]MBT5213791.1 MerR family transcriptional regulator [Pelagibacteraceae bacterium]